MYNLSTDYERLYQLMQEEKDPVCVKGKYLFQFIQDDLEMYFDKESFITYCKDFNLRWIDPQPVHPHPDLNKRNIERAYQLGAKSIIEQLKGLQRNQACELGASAIVVDAADIETIINQNK